MVLAFVITGCTSANTSVRSAPDGHPEEEPAEADDEAESSYELYFERVPAQLGVGETLQLSVSAEEDGRPTEPASVSFESRTPRVLTIDAAGQIRGIAVGMAYLEAHNARGVALAEIEVVER